MMRERQERLAEAMLKPINPAAIILLGIFTVIWGIWVGNPFWDVFTDTRTIYVFISFAPEWLWGLVATVVGLIISYGSIVRRVTPLIHGAELGGIFWLIISIGYLVGDWAHTGGITALLLAVYCAFIYLNLKVNRLHGATKDDLFI